MQQSAPSFVDFFRLPKFKTRADELAFWQRHDTRLFEFRKFFICLSILIIAGLGILDVVAADEATNLLLSIRAINVLLMILIFYFFCQPQSPLMRDVLIIMTGFVVVASLSIMVVIGPVVVAETYPFIIVAAMIYGHCLFVPRVQTQAAFCAITGVIFTPTFFFVEISTHTLFLIVFVLSITAVSVLLGALVRERLEREHAINETDLSRAMDEALKANRAKSNLLANVSHELRTPLNAIIGFSEMMSNEVFGRIEQDVYRQYAEDIHFSGKLLHANIDDLLDLSRLEVDKMNWKEEEISIPNVLQSVIKTCAPQDKSINVVLSSAFQHVEITMLTDMDRISQVFINIITNAMKFSKSGTTIHISYEQGPDGAVIFRIADQGIGISEDDLGRIREPFNQASRSSYVAANTGLGLGLSIVNGILERCESTLTIESELGVGTTVFIKVPAKRISVSKIHQRRGLGRISARQLAG